MLWSLVLSLMRAGLVLFSRLEQLFWRVNLRMMYYCIACLSELVF